MTSISRFARSWLAPRAQAGWGSARGWLGTTRLRNATTQPTPRRLARSARNRKDRYIFAIATALSAALVYGAADFLGGLASRRTTTLAVVVWSQATGFVVLAVTVPFVPGTFHAPDLVWGAVCGIVGAGAVGLLYRGLSIGAMGVVSPITAVLAAILPVVYGALHHVRLSLATSVGIGLALVAVVAISAAPPVSGMAARRGLAEAVGAGVLFGMFFVVLAQTRTDAGLNPLIGARTASFVAFMLAGTLLRRSFWPARNALGMIVAGGACDMLANVLYVIAVHSGGLAIVAVITSLYPASTVALAALVLHERLRGIQWAGVAAAFVGVALISAGK